MNKGIVQTKPVACAFLAVLALCFGPTLSANPPTDDALVDIYGQLPSSRNYAISPTGKHVAAIARSGDQEVVMVIDRVTRKQVGAHPFGKVIAGELFFLTDEHLLISFHNSTRRPFQRYLVDFGGAIVLDVGQNKAWRVLGDKRNTASKEMTRVVGIDRARGVFYTPGYSEKRDTVDLYEVDLATGRSKRFAVGDDHTVDWFLDADGKIVAREDYDFRRDRRRVYAYNGKKKNKVFDVVDRDDRIYFGAISEDGKHLVYRENIKDRQITTVSLESGETTQETVADPGQEVQALSTLDPNRRFIGTKLSGVKPGYRMQKPILTSILNRLAVTFPGSSITLVSASSDENFLIFRISGNQGANDYYLLDRNAEQFIPMGSQYPDVPRSNISEITEFKFTTRDGLALNGIVTLPEGSADAGLPAVVLPHGGPRSYDYVKFDWMSQLFARAGYLVFQPNYRGSTGKGIEHEALGHGQSGLKIQDDINDGLNALVEKDMVDPKRVCIVGASYGGYAALMAGAKTPELYRCVVSIAGVSDLEQMIKNTQVAEGHGDYYTNRWLDRMYGDLRTTNRKLKETSPVNLVANFTAPVLLVHGTDDYIVRIRHSQRMAKQLERFNKQVRLVELKNEHHWLSRNATRKQAAREILAFLRQQNPV